jgi:hypothetical protein
LIWLSKVVLAQQFCTWCWGWQKTQHTLKANTYCWLARLFDWSRWVAIGSLPAFARPVSVFWARLRKSKQLILDVRNTVRGPHTEHKWAALSTPVISCSETSAQPNTEVNPWSELYAISFQIDCIHLLAMNHFKTADFHSPCWIVCAKADQNREVTLLFQKSTKQWYCLCCCCKFQIVQLLNA